MAVDRAPAIKTEITTRLDMGSDGPPADVSVVIPCLNEANSLAFCVEKALKSFQAGGLRGEVVVADNGSTDGSIEIAEKLGARVVRVEQRGYGAALRA
jgi:glycosyltransferase involved in cell wall biosynthesis